MKQHAKSQRVLQTIGVMATLLPYLSKSYEEWGDLMWNTCHSSRISWMKYELAFLNRHMECEFNSDEELTAILISTGIDLKPKLNSEFNLTLDADRKLKNVQGFLKAVKQFRFKSMNKLSIQMFENLDKKSIQDSYHFLKFSIPLKINSFEIKCDDSDIKSYLNSLTILLPRVYHKVEVNSFVLTQKDIKTIIELSRNAEELVFINCSYGKISEDFSLRVDLKYKIKCLALTPQTYCFNYDKVGQQHRLSIIGGAYARLSDFSSASIFYSLEDYNKYKSSNHAEMINVENQNKLSIQQGLKA